MIITIFNNWYSVIDSGFVRFWFGLIIVIYLITTIFAIIYKRSD